MPEHVGQRREGDLDILYIYIITYNYCTYIYICLSFEMLFSLYIQSIDMCLLYIYIFLYIYIYLSIYLYFLIDMSYFLKDAKVYLGNKVGTITCNQPVQAYPVLKPLPSA